MSYKSISIIMFVTALLNLASCSRMRYFSREEVFRVKDEASIVVITKTGARYELSQPQLVDSVLVGVVRGMGNQRFAVTDIDSIGIKELDQGKTAILGIVGVTGALIIISNLIPDDDDDGCGG